MEVVGVIAMIIFFLWMMSKSDKYTDLDEEERRRDEKRGGDGEGD